MHNFADLGGILAYMHHYGYTWLHIEVGLLPDLPTKISSSLNATMTDLNLCVLILRVASNRRKRGAI